MATGDIGLIGLAVMGQNLILNMNDKGFTVVAYNRTTSKVDNFLANEAKGTKVQGAWSIQELCAKLKTPRKIILLVKAGQAVDDFIAQLEPYLEPGDIVIDGGNSHYPDSIRRTKELESKGFLFVGSGVSGGEEGARNGPSLMPGGSTAAWPAIKEIFQKTAAQAYGEPCCDWVGETGSGHYVKMVHNGIEYGDMQLIAEAYDILKRGLGLHEDEIADIFLKWNKGVLDSFLIDITANILKFKDDDGEPVVTKILDKAGQKGTGKWTAIAALDAGTPVTLIGEAVFARCLSAIKEERVRASKVIAGPQKEPFRGDKQLFIDDLEQALYASKIISYTQGFMLMRETAKELGWNLNYAGIASMWRGGCIIKSVFLSDITAAYRKDPKLESLLFDDFFNKAVHTAQPGWRRVIAQAVLWGIPTPAFSTALAFFDGYRSEIVPANLLQGQRDYFGAHTFRVLPGKENEKFKTADMCSSVPNVGKRKALLIGIGEPNRPGPRNDALKMKKLLMDKYMYKKTDIVLMHDKQRIGRLMPTKDNILREIDNLVRDCQPGDRFVFHYSGHTGQQKNLDGTEVDGLDELIETTTGPILDDVLRVRLVDPLCPGSQLVAVLDSCHSATLLDLPHVDCQLSNTKLVFADEPPKEYPRVILADLKRPLAQCKNRLVRQPSSSKQPRAKKPRLGTLDTVTRSPTPSFTSSGPLTSIPPQTQASGFFSPVASNDDAPDYIKAKGAVDASSPSTPSVDFYDGEKCCKCRLTLKDESQKDRLELPRVVAISSCKDSQVSYEDGNRMTKVLCNYLRANPNPSLRRLFNGISFSLFTPAYKRAKSESWIEWARFECRGGSRPNAYQHPSLSSLQRLNPNHKLSL